MVVAFSQTQHVPGERHERRGCVRRCKALNLSELQFFVFLFLKSLLFKTKSCYATWSGLTFSAFLPQSLEGWGYRLTPWLPVSSLFNREVERKWPLQRAFERLKRILKVKVDAHSGCSWKMRLSFLPSFLGSCFHGKQLSSDPATPQPSCLGLHTARSASQQLGAAYNPNRGWLWLNNFIIDVF